LTLCVLAAGVLTALAGDAFTLAWSHSVEKTRWEEDWRVTPAGLELVEARVKGSGAGMEPPEGSVLDDGWWVYTPDLPAQERLVLAASGATGEGWSLCVTGGRCLTLGATKSAPVVLQACSGAH
jgi:hypothetical protein